MSIQDDTLELKSRSRKPANPREDMRQSSHPSTDTLSEDESRQDETQVRLARERVKKLTEDAISRQLKASEPVSKPDVAPAVPPATEAETVEDKPADVLAPQALTAPDERLIAPADVQRHAAALRWINGRPPWAQNRFECLMFKVAGLHMAVPLVALGGIYPISSAMTPLFGQADWFMGLQTVNGETVRIVNTARYILPDRYEESFLKDIKYLLTINGYQWGLGVNEVEEAVTFDPAYIRWRTPQGKRPWLAGTVVDSMCALIDVQAMALEFVEEEANSTT